PHGDADDPELAINYGEARPESRRFEASGRATDYAYIAMRPLALDRATTTPLDPRVVEAMRPWWNASASIPAASGARGRAARQAVEEARACVARLVGAPPEEILFTSSATESNNLALKGLAGAAPRPGRLLAAATEHHSVLHPLRTLERQGHAIDL